MFGVSLIKNLRNDDIREKTKITDMARTISKLKWEWACHVCGRTDGRESRSVLERKPRLGNLSVGRPPAHWTNDLHKVVDGRWMRTAEDWVK